MNLIASIGLIHNDLEKRKADQGRPRPAKKNHPVAADDAGRESVHETYPASEYDTRLGWKVDVSA